jgi:predicted transcriptional regulator
MNIHRFRALHAAGATFVEIGRECGCDWRTVRKYLAEDAPTAYFSRESPEALPHLTYQVSASRSSCEQIQFKVIAKHGALTLGEVLAGRGV